MFQSPNKGGRLTKDYFENILPYKITIIHVRLTEPLATVRFLEVVRSRTPAFVFSTSAGKDETFFEIIRHANEWKSSSLGT